MRAATSSSSSPSSPFTSAAAALTRPSQRTTGTGTRSPETGKLSTALVVSPPQSCSVKVVASIEFVVPRAYWRLDPAGDRVATCRTCMSAPPLALADAAADPGLARSLVAVGAAGYVGAPTGAALGAAPAVRPGRSRGPGGALRAGGGRGADPRFAQPQRDRVAEADRLFSRDRGGAPVKTQQPRLVSVLRGDPVERPEAAVD